MNIAVFCSQYDVAEKYKRAAEALAHGIAAGKHTLIWGGADEGLMGLVARSSQHGGARVVGVMREAIKDKALATADEIVVVPNAYEMNLGLVRRSDVAVALVGGIGTLNELTEVIRMKKNGTHDNPMVIINTDGFYSGLKQQLQMMNDEGFLKKEVTDAVYFADTPEEAMRYIETHGN